MNMIAGMGKGIGLLAMLTMLAACGSPSGSQMQEIPVVSTKPYIYDPNQKHAPVSLSGSDLIGLEPRAR